MITHILSITVYKDHDSFFGGLLKSLCFYKFSDNIHRKALQWSDDESSLYVSCNDACSLQILSHTAHRWSQDLGDHL